MREELQKIRQIQAEIGALRDRAAHSCRDARSAVRMAKALELLREADAILKMEVAKIESGTMRSSDLARAALGWNLNSVHGRLVLARETLEGLR